METINDIMPTTPDLNAERIEKLKELFPDLFTEAGLLNSDELKNLVDPDAGTGRERYEFNWNGKRESKRKAFTPSTATLIYDEARSVNPEQANGNIIIEGENLESLKCLLSAYREKVKCIYIDPPYNTGKDFVYSDNYTADRAAYWESTNTEDGVNIDTNSDSSGRFHSDWLSMMHPRLLLARQLLSPDGVIFISIDDNEVSNLRKLCDGVFGEDCFVESFVWKKSYGGGPKEKYAVTQHEYVLLYAKQKDLLEVFNLNYDPAKIDRYYKNRDDNFDIRGPYRLKPLEATKSMDARPNLVYGIPGPDGTEVFPKRQWLWGKERVLTALKNGELEFINSAHGKTYNYKQYLRDEEGQERGEKPFSVIDGIYTQSGTDDLNQLFDGEVIVQFPKPVELLKKFVEIGVSDISDAIVLDFFAGSGTTGQAVSEFNISYKKNVKYIMIQIPELTAEDTKAFKKGFKKISDITIERNKRMIERMTAKATAEPDLFNGEFKAPGFKVYHLAKSTFPRVDFTPDPAKSEAENVEALKSYIEQKERVLFAEFDQSTVFDEVLLKNGFMLNYTLSKQEEFKDNAVYLANDTEKSALICLDGQLQASTVALLSKGRKFICLERALDTTKKWNLRNQLGEEFIAF